MCGLVGMMGDFAFAHKDAMGDLLFLDTLRGKDSTGVAAVRPNGDVAWYKATMPGYEYIDLPGYKSLITCGDRVWLGHNRFSTVGKITKQNAHPFVVTDNDEDAWSLVGAHNGTLKNKYQIDNKQEYGTDSEALMNLIAKVGAKEAIAQIEGAWALTWFDGVDERLHMLRNKERPLSFAFTKDKKVLMWASEAWMLRAAAGRRGIELDIMYTCKEDTLYSFDLPTYKGADRLLSEPKVEGGVTGKPEPVKAPFQRNDEDGMWYDYPARRTAYPTQQTGTQGTTPPAAAGDAKVTPHPIGADEVAGFEGVPIKRTLLKTLADFGCAWCEDKIDLNQRYAFASEDDLVCVKCLNGTHFHSVAEERIKSKNLILTPKQEEKLRELRESKIQAADQARQQVG